MKRIFPLLISLISFGSIAESIEYRYAGPVSGDGMYLYHSNDEVVRSHSAKVVCADGVLVVEGRGKYSVDQKSCKKLMKSSEHFKNGETIFSVSFEDKSADIIFID